MSVYRENATQMNDADCLVKALGAVRTASGKKWEPVVHKEKVNLKGYGGDTRAQKAEIVIPKNQVQGAANDIGFEKGPDGNFIAHISQYDSGFYNAQWLGELKQEYAKEKVKKTARTIGATFLGERKTKDGSIVYRFAKA
jgi:hypothetical protein